MFKEEVASLKEHIHNRRKQVKACREMKASPTGNDLVVRTDFVESYKNDQQDAIKSEYFGNQCFIISTACCYFNVDRKIKTVMFPWSSRSRTTIELH